MALAATGQAQMIVGHRGASHDAPENTLAAFQEAWRQGADGVEGDFHLTQDGHIVCIHDADTARTGGKKLIVASSTLAELRSLEYGGWKGKQFVGEPLPTFSDVLAIVPADKTFVIELKTRPEIVPVLVRELQQVQSALPRLLIIAFDAQTVAACKQQLPDVTAHWLTSYKQNKLTGVFTPTLATIAQTLRDCSADGLGTKGERQVVNADFMNQLQQRGLKEFHVWTIDDPSEARYFQGLGAIGITTNRPALIRQALN